ncbi:uncharacterized protein [Procambarus clarkii]|uniref:uncharacterized protein n=1 Tax=Procambarus clarkii TaxID=6728 RepID=UPI001E672A26|nr:uncharacterized protein LOC123774559 [Procambarus clarkii]XP_045624876.1 uncharacterized protein LOC123774559 [Procambarus clarkii]
MYEMKRCCCLSLRTGALIVGVTDMLFDSIHLVLGVFAIVSFSGTYIVDGLNDDPLSVAHMVVEAIVAFIDFIFAGLLLRGVHKECLRKVTMWLWWTALQLLVQITASVIFLFYEERVQGWHIVLAVLVFSFLVFCLHVVHSYARSLKRKKRLASEIFMHENQLMDI